MFAGILIGLILGVGVSIGAAWYINKLPSPFVNTNSTRPATPDLPPAQVAAVPQPPENHDSDKPKFDFYKILPDQQAPAVAKAQAAPQQAPVKPAEAEVKTPAVVAKAPAPEPRSFFVQAGSFHSRDDADNMKAKLAMLGLESSIDSGADSTYRVRIGPFNNQGDIDKAQQNLRQNGIPSSVVKN
ncbi:MAG: SPOR domain-containing protein [Burkholderiales bacterium]|nr:SPOR domain-containing protein [Burkholderiales bacterium]